MNFSSVRAILDESHRVMYSTVQTGERTSRVSHERLSRYESFLEVGLGIGIYEFVLFVGIWKKQNRGSGLDA